MVKNVAREMYSALNGYFPLKCIIIYTSKRKSTYLDPSGAQRMEVIVLVF